MTLHIRPKVYSLPSYSLTGDLLGFLRCGLQYRYLRIGRLPSSRPVQLWFGQFIHGVLEEAFRRYRDSVERGAPDLPPWSNDVLESMFTLIEDRLAAAGIVAWTEDLKDLGRKRATSAVQELGPHLLPLIHRAEVRVTGARLLPAIDGALQFREADRYEMVGVVDVVTNVELADPALAENPVVKSILRVLGSDLPPRFEVIIDYKGMRRPPSLGSGGAGSLWTQYEWQLQTYGELRRRQADSLPVAAGVILYVNELHPTRSDLLSLREEIAAGTTDVPPAPGSDAEAALRTWKIRDRGLPVLPFEYRMARALRVVPITDTSIASALTAFDGVVKDIETCRGREVHGQPVLKAWEKNSSDESTCVVCDWRTFCPEFRAKYAREHGELHPKLPAFKAP